MSYATRPTQLLGDYAQLRSIPALLSVAFTLSSLYEFGGLAGLELTWLNYTLTANHAMLLSLGSFVVAFASSETKQFANYEQWQQILIGAGPALIILHHTIPYVGNLTAENPAMGMFFYLISLTSWGVAIK